MPLFKANIFGSHEMGIKFWRGEFTEESDLKAFVKTEN